MPLLRLITCKDWPHLNEDDKLLTHALTTAGIEFEICLWDDPTIDWTKSQGILIRSPWDYVQKRKDFLTWLSFVESLKIPKWNSSFSNPIYSWVKIHQVLPALQRR